MAGSIFGGLGVMTGAFGAHALKEMLTANGRTETFELAVRYQLLHALALLAVGLLMKERSARLEWAATLMVAGTVCFSGSLYVISLTALRSGLVFITPLGGTLLIAGWCMLALGILKQTHTDTDGARR